MSTMYEITNQMMTMVKSFGNRVRKKNWPQTANSRKNSINFEIRTRTVHEIYEHYNFWSTFRALYVNYYIDTHAFRFFELISIFLYSANIYSVSCINF